MLKYCFKMFLKCLKIVKKKIEIIQHISNMFKMFKYLLDALYTKKNM